MCILPCTTSHYLKALQMCSTQCKNIDSCTFKGVYVGSCFFCFFLDGTVFDCSVPEWVLVSTLCHLIPPLLPNSSRLLLILDQDFKIKCQSQSMVINLSKKTELPSLLPVLCSFSALDLHLVNSVGWTGLTLCNIGLSAYLPARPICFTEKSWFLYCVCLNVSVTLPALVFFACVCCMCVCVFASVCVVDWVGVEDWPQPNSQLFVLACL